jgi:hypothetical protein
LTIAMAEQEAAAGRGETLFDLLLRRRGPPAGVRARSRDLEQRLSDPASAAEYADRIHEYRESGGFLAEAEAAGWTSPRTTSIWRPASGWNGRSNRSRAHAY